jgi:hypothetical protein
MVSDPGLAVPMAGMPAGNGVGPRAISSFPIGFELRA